MKSRIEWFCREEEYPFRQNTLVLISSFTFNTFTTGRVIYLSTVRNVTVMYLSRRRAESKEEMKMKALRLGAVVSIIQFIASRSLRACRKSGSSVASLVGDVHYCSIRITSLPTAHRVIHVALYKT